MKKNRRLVACHGSQLGDVWAAMNSAILNGYDLSTYSNKSHGRFVNVRRKILEVRSLLERGDEVGVVDRVSKDRFCCNEELWGTPYVSTKIKWEKRNHGRICYQFDGITSRGIKNLTKEDEKLFFNRYYNIIRLGKHLSLKECVKIASTSDIFVGVCSGMSHLCHSVGVPVYLVGHPRLHKFHIGKEYIYCKDMKEFVSRYSNTHYNSRKQSSRLSI